MNAKKLLLDLELYEEINELKKLGLTDEEIDGFMEFDWDIKPNLMSLILEIDNAKH